MTRAGVRTCPHSPGVPRTGDARRGAGVDPRQRMAWCGLRRKRASGSGSGGPATRSYLAAWLGRGPASLGGRQLPQRPYRSEGIPATLRRVSRWARKSGERCAKEGASLRTPIHRAAWLGAAAIAGIAGIAIPLALIHHGNGADHARAAAPAAAQAPAAATAPATARSVPFTTTMQQIQQTVQDAQAETESALARAKNASEHAPTTTAATTAAATTTTAAMKAIQIGDAATLDRSRRARVTPGTTTTTAPAPIAKSGDSSAKVAPESPPPGPLAIQSVHVTG